ncbi:hypothetical protein B0J17DRAFT_714326 [Rhizoctonia solani]|nr:hypothetical protein B0J17DRAFT_714326 [Rhizoctonia solani]
MYCGYTDASIKLREEVVTAREHLSAALNRYAEISLKVRNCQRRGRPAGPDVVIFHSQDAQLELRALIILEEKLQEAKINFTRALDLETTYANPFHYPPTINRLPQEILVRIFQLVQLVEPCELHLLDEHGHRGYPRYPDYLAQVCPHWRDIALASPYLWCHIDLSPHPEYEGSLLTRAKHHADRAGQLPLELHIADADCTTAYDEGSDLQRFLASIVGRIISLQVYRTSWYIDGFETAVYEEIFRGGSGTLTELTVHSQSLDHAAFIEPTTEDNYDFEGLVTVDLSLEQIERTLEHIQVLRLSELFPHWDSKAYHGLVDLRLASHCKTEATQVSQSQFVTILKASPGLRVLHFALQLTNVGQTDTPNPHAILKYLEVLSVSMYGDGDGNNLSQVASVLRLITPGSKPLRLTLQTGTYSDPSLLDTIKQFMLRSRISRFCAKKGAPPPYELIECAPHLTDLVFDRCSYDLTSERLPIDLNHASSSDSPIRLDSLHIHMSQFYSDDLRLVVGQYTTRSLVLSNCRVYDKASAPGEVSVAELVASFAYLPQPLRFLTHEGLPPNPTACWNELD